MPSLAGLGPWTWLIGGLVLVGLEALLPGVFLIWLGLAAIGTGVLDAFLDLSWQASLLVFAGLSLVSVAAGRLLTRRRDEEGGEATTLNRRGAALVGRVFTLDRPIAGGEGRVRVDDTSWRVLGPDLPAGAAVRVAAVEGATLRVTAAES